MDELVVAELGRMNMVLANGPGRRMAQDKALGRGPSRDDLAQAENYRLRIVALEAGRL